MGDVFLFVMSWLWVPAVGWLLFGLPWWDKRSKARSEAARKEFWRQMHNAEIDYAARCVDGEDYLRRRLIADLREMRKQQQAREWLDAMMNDELEKLPPHLRRIVRKSYEEVRP